MDSVSQYVENNQQVVDLHRQMQECDAVLARMQDMLHGFQADLGGISDEIKHLQDESTTMSIRLRNRRAAEERLHKFLDHSTVSPEMAEIIASNDINEQFLEAVVSLSTKLGYLQQTQFEKDTETNFSPAETFTGKSLLPDLERLKMRALYKSRDYFTAQFNALRKPKTNVQVLQQTSLVKYAKLLQFIQAEAPAVGEDLR